MNSAPYRALAARKAVERNVLDGAPAYPDVPSSRRPNGSQLCDAKRMEPRRSVAFTAFSSHPRPHQPAMVRDAANFRYRPGLGLGTLRGLIPTFNPTQIIPSFDYRRIPNYQ
jgi:hypothetical protein